MKKFLFLILNSIVIFQRRITRKIERTKMKIRIFWGWLWIRKDEFHKSLDLDGVSLLVMTDREKKLYLEDLIRRRRIAHERDLKSLNVGEPFSRFADLDGEKKLIRQLIKKSENLRLLMS